MKYLTLIACDKVSPDPKLLPSVPPFDEGIIPFNCKPGRDYLYTGKFLRTSLAIPFIGFSTQVSMKARNLRDLAKRVAAAEAEPLRQALRFITRNTTLAPRARAQAQLQLGNLPSNTRINQVKNRCVETARGRGVFRDFRLCRVKYIV